MNLPRSDTVPDILFGLVLEVAAEDTFKDLGTWHFLQCIASSQLPLKSIICPVPRLNMMLYKLKIQGLIPHCPALSTDIYTGGK